ncbi:50S ribosomal protein L34e [Candidatus Woesearchaeota archaeon]|nr:50S ribosomal protein L34e [Candidatus Woesearchaeota archaeon]
MPEGKFRSRTFRRIHVRTPGGKSVLHYRRRKPSKPTCAGCGRVLAGVPQELPHDLKKIAKSSRRPERPYGGVLCTVCSRQLWKDKTRIEPTEVKA